MTTRLSLHKRRAIAAALDAHELTHREICREFGVGHDTLMLVKHDQGLDTRISAATNAATRTVPLRGQGDMP